MKWKLQIVALDWAERLAIEEPLIPGQLPIDLLNRAFG